MNSQGDARKAAQEEEDRLKEDKVSAQRENNERKEKAHLRHKHAHKKTLLGQDMDRLMNELDHLEQADRRRRQAIVAKIPVSIITLFIKLCAVASAHYFNDCCSIH